MAGSELEYVVVNPFGYSVEELDVHTRRSPQSITALVSNTNAVTSETSGLALELHEGVAVINAMPDGNCGPRAIIQSLCIAGVAGSPECRQFVHAFMQQLYQRQHNAVDSENRSLYGSALYRSSAFNHRLYEEQYRNVCVYDAPVLYYYDFEGHVTTHELDHEQQRCLQAHRNHRITYDQLTMLLSAQQFDAGARMRDTQRDVREFLDSYINLNADQMAQVRQEYFVSSSQNPFPPAKDHVIYLLAGCLRFDMTDYLQDESQLHERLILGQLELQSRPVRPLNRTKAMAILRQLETPMEFNDMIGYFLDHQISCRSVGRFDANADGVEQWGYFSNTDDSETRGLFGNSERFAVLPSQVSIELYYTPGHFMSFLRQSRDSMQQLAHSFDELINVPFLLQLILHPLTAVVAMVVTLATMMYLGVLSLTATLATGVIATLGFFAVNKYIANYIDDECDEQQDEDADEFLNFDDYSLV